MTRKPPAYRRRSAATPHLAPVTLTNAHTGQRKMFALGEYGTPASRELYHRLIAQWEASGRRLPELGVSNLDTLSVTGLVAAY